MKPARTEIAEFRAASRERTRIVFSKMKRRAPIRFPRPSRLQRGPMSRVFIGDDGDAFLRLSLETNGRGLAPPGAAAIARVSVVQTSGIVK